MADTPYPIPPNQPEDEHYCAGMAQTGRAWQLAGLTPPNLSGGTPSTTASNRFLYGHWTDYPTYCLIAWPAVPASNPDDEGIRRLEALKTALVAAHLLLLGQIERRGKHYKSRLRGSFRAFRDATHEPGLRAALPDDLGTLDTYLAGLKAVEASSTSTKRALDDLILAFEGALEGRGGHTRTTTEKLKIRVRTISERGSRTRGRFLYPRRKPLDKSTTRPLRLSPEENASGPVWYQELEPVARHSGETTVSRVLKARGKQNGIVRGHQLLPFDWNRLSLFDLARFDDALHDKAAEVAGNHGVDPDELEALTALVFWLGRPANDVQAAKLVPTPAQVPSRLGNQGLYITADSNLAVVRRYQPPGAKTVARKWGPYTRGSHDRVYLPLPDAARRHTANWFAKRRQRGAHSPFTLKRPSECVQEVIARIRQDTGARVTPTRLANQLPLTVANHCGDRTVASALFAKPIENMPTAGLYYLSVSQEHLSRTYWKTAASVSAFLLGQKPRESFPGLPTDDPVGSLVCPKKDIYQWLAKDLAAAVARSRKHLHRLDGRVRHHNAFTTYCVAMLAALTGYRAVKDPFSDATMLDPDSGFLLISDKDFDDYRSARLVWVPDPVVEQLSVYEDYRQTLLSIFGLDPARTPFFFFLEDRYGGYGPVKPKELAAQLDWAFEVPLNGNRHFLRTELTNRGAAGEIIEAFMGHWNLGEEPHGKYSGLAPSDVAAVLRPILSDLAKELGWTVIHP